MRAKVGLSDKCLEGRDGNVASRMCPSEAGSMGGDGSQASRAHARQSADGTEVMWDSDMSWSLVQDLQQVCGSRHTLVSVSMACMRMLRPH